MPFCDQAIRSVHWNVEALLNLCSSKTVFSISFSLPLWITPHIQWGFLAPCRALSCSALTRSCLSLAVGGSSKDITASAKLSLLFPPCMTFCVAIWITHSALLHSHSVQLVPPTTAFSKFSFQLPWIIKYLQTMALYYTVPSPDP